MRTYQTSLLITIFILGLVVFSGCDCGQTVKRKPVTTIATAPRPVAEVQVARATQGVCWVEPLDQQITLDRPPTVTLNQYGQVISSTPPGRVQAPTAPGPAFGYNR